MRAEQLLRAAGLDADEVDRVVRTALAEDGASDITSEPIFTADERATADVVARAAGVLAGLPVAAMVFDRLGAVIEPVPAANDDRTAAGYGHWIADGHRIAAGDVLLTVTGPTRALLRAERTALNLLTHLSGVATVTRAWVDAVAGTRARIRDTRKTLPGLRVLQKYAVRCGGGVNHRMGLSDAALIKDNHIAAAGSVSAAYGAVRDRHPGPPIQLECDTLEQVREALAAGVGAILLDNMSPGQLAEAVRLAAGRAELEASGGLTLDAARDVAVTGVDYLAVGALTHSAAVLDIGLDFRSGTGE